VTPERPSRVRTVGAFLAAAAALALAVAPASASDPVAAASGCVRTAVVHERPQWWTRQRATVLVDSVLLGGVDALRRRLRGWTVQVVGHPAVMVSAIERTIRTRPARVAPLAIVGVGYNSLWERGRRDYRHWAAEFDRSARAFRATLRRRGARQIVWVTLRDARASVVPAGAQWQQRRYAWYFPYVNERLHRLDRAHDDLVLADWAAVSDRTGLTYDAIHLDPDGAALMARTIRRAIDEEGRRQTLAARPRRQC
jgi:hypothetical protein